MDDGRIIELFFERSESAISELDKKYGRRLRVLSANLLGDSFDAEECVNDAYLGVWRSIPPERPWHLLSYVSRIVRNLSLKRYQRNTAKKRNSHYDLSLEELEDSIPSSDSPDSRLLASELSDCINGFLSGLDRSSRVMFVRRYWFADPIVDIAKDLGMSAHAVTVRLSRIRAGLSRYLTEKGVSL